MPGTASSSKNNAWIAYVRQCAKEYKSSKEQAKVATGGKHTKGTKHAAISKEEQTVKGWKDRQQEVYKKQSHANMKRSGEIARKAEQNHLVRKRLTTKQKEN